MTDATPQPLWPLPLLALVQLWFGMALFSPLKEPGAAWNGGYAALSAVGSLAGLAVVAMAVRNCLRLWRVPPQGASWALVVSTALVASLGALVATGPVTSGVWRWWALLPGGLAAYLLVILGREIRRIRVRRSAPAGSSFHRAP